MLSGIVISSWSISSCWNVKTWQQDCNLSKTFCTWPLLKKNMLCVANSNSSKDHKNCFHSIKTCNCLKQNQVNRMKSTLTIIYLQFRNTFVRSWKMLLIMNFIIRICGFKFSDNIHFYSIVLIDWNEWIYFHL